MTGIDATHHPWPPPSTPWVMAQVWSDLLFAHWPLSPEALRPLIPASLELDTFEGRAWVGVVPFRMSGVRPRGLPPVPYMSAFPELNVRTYVTTGGKSGVCFFSLDAANPIAVAIARRWYRLPYYNAHMGVRGAGKSIAYLSRRTHRGAAPAEFSAVYRPVSGPARSAPGTIEHWLTERYCLYTTRWGGRLYRAEILHAPWPLQPAEADIRTNTMALAGGIALPEPRRAPLLHFARRLEVVVWPLRPV